MARKRNQKTKIMIICDIIKKARGKENAVSTKEILHILEENDIPCDRRTIKSDIETLAEYVSDNELYDFNIFYFLEKYGNMYYSESKEFSNTLNFSFDEIAAILNGLNTLNVTDTNIRTDIDLLKKKLLSSSDPLYRDKLASYAYDQVCLIDTIAAKVIIDAVNSLAFMNKKTANNLMSLIINMADSEYKNALEQEKSNPIYDTPSKSSINIYEFDTLFRAIDCHKKVKFRYFNLNEKKERVYHRNGSSYTVEPISMLPVKEHYYLLCYDSLTEDKMRTYRIDRMCSVTESDESISEDAVNFIEKIPKLVHQTFNMYSGPLRTVTLEFSPKLIDNILDAFGFDTVIEKTSGGNCRITEDIQISPTFFSWIFQFAGKMKIIEPQDVIVQYRTMCLDVIADTENDIKQPDT